MVRFTLSEGTTPMKMRNLQDLLLDQVRDLYDAEKQLGRVDNS